MSQRRLDNETFERAQAMAHVGIWTLDPTTLDLVWSDEVYRLLGMDPATDEATFDAAMERFDPDVRAAAEQILATVVRDGVSGRWGFPTDVDGEIRWIEWFGGPNEQGVIVGFAQDGTERREYLAQLEAQQARSDLAESVAGLGSWVQNVDTGEVTWSPHLCELLGTDPATFVPEPDSLLPLAEPESRAPAQAFLRALWRGEDPGPLELTVVRPDGERRWFEVRGRCINGSRRVGVVQDITERRQREERLCLQAQILGAMSECVVLIRPHDELVLWSNQQAAAELGITVDELVGRHAGDFTAPGQERLLAEIRRQLEHEGAWQGEIERLKADGSPLHTEARLTVMDHPGHGPVWLSVSFDVGERRARERALRESRLRLQAVQDHAPTGIASLSLDGRVLYVNDALCTILGRSRAELENRSVLAEAHLTENEVCSLADLLAGRTTTARAERRYVRPDGEAVWALCTSSLVRDPAGEAQFLLVHLVDITAHKAAEELRQRQALALERANQAKTAFLSRTSHELRTPLNAVLGFGQLLTTADLAPQDHLAAEQIVHAGRHLLELIDEVLDIARVESGTLDLRVEPVDMGDVVNETLELVQPMAGSLGITATGTVDGHGRDAPQHPFVRGDRRRIAQVLLNLLSNAIKYNRPGGTVTVTTVPGTDTVRIAVADTGRGIPDEAMSRLFEPFERLGIEREGIEGTGLGLALALALARDMGGTITVESVAGEGSTFTLELPADGAPRAVPSGDPRRTTAGPDTPPAAGADRTIRVVNIEDNPANQQLVQAILRRRRDVELWTTPDATSGLARIREHQPHLVLLDLDLPDIPGDEVLRQLRADPPPLAPVIAVCSADANPAQIAALTGMGADHYLTKPFEIPALLAIVDDAGRPERSGTSPSTRSMRG